MCIFFILSVCLVALLLFLQTNSSSCEASCWFLKYLNTLSSIRNGDGSEPPIPGTPTLRNRTFTSITLQWEPVNTTNGTSVYLIAVEFNGDSLKSPYFINTVRTLFRVSFFLKFSRPTCQFIYSHLFLFNFLNPYHSVRVLNTTALKKQLMFEKLGSYHSFTAWSHNSRYSSSALACFRSYMHDRQQYLRIGSQMSGIRKSTHGVPQGSILKPALFNVFINYLPGVPDYCSLRSFVDDSKLHLSFPVKEIDSAVRQITEDLKKVALWCCPFSLLINLDKTKLLLIGTRQ